MVKKTNPKTDAILTSAYFVADKYSISNRALAELAAAFTTIDGKNLEGLNLSVNTTRKRKTTLRQEHADLILQSKLCNKDKNFSFCWDSKLIVLGKRQLQ